jgi:predicted RNase H-like nuclease (RuvC/YqgF family)
MPESRTAQVRSRGTAGVHQLHELVLPSTAPRASRFVEKLNIPYRDQAGERTAAERTTDIERALPDYLQALELVSGAAQTMQSMEEQSTRIQTKAFELMQQARSERQESHERIANLVEQLTASEARAEELERQLAEAELRAQTAEQWLGRFMETVNEAFAVRKSRLAEADLSAALDQEMKKAAR